MKEDYYVLIKNKLVIDINKKYNEKTLRRIR